MKYLGILILAVGVGLSAAYGSRLSDSVSERTTAQGRAKFAKAGAAQAKKAYCKARDEADLEPGPRCPKKDEGKNQGDDEGQKKEKDQKKSTKSKVEESVPFEQRLRSELEALRAAPTGDELPEPVAKKRAAWLEAKEAAIEPQVRAKSIEPPGPGQRLREWFTAAKTFFLLGLGLVVAGAVLGRVAVRREAAAGAADTGAKRSPYRRPAGGAAAETTEEKGPFDFGQMLESLRVEMQRLVDEAREHDTAPGDEVLDRIKTKIEELQNDFLEPMVEARGQMQIKYGLGGFAALYGPLSGAERKVSRAWSTLVDRHWEETCTALEEGLGQVQETQQELQKLMKSDESTPS